MATLPDNTFFGNAPTDEQNAFWLSGGSPQGAMQPAGDADSAAWTAGAAPIDLQRPPTSDALKQAQADAEYLTKIQEAQRAMGQVNDPADLKAYEPYLRAAAEARAAVFDNPEYGAQWLKAREVEAKQETSTRFDAVSREQALANTDAFLTQLNASALQASGHEAVPFIDTGTRLMQGLMDSGLIDGATAQAKKEHWLQTYVEARIKQLPPAEQVAALADAPGEGNAAQGQAGTERQLSMKSVLPPDTRARLLHEAQSELDRQNTEQVFARTQHYEDSIGRALTDGTPLPSRDDIVFDPSLDGLSRERLLQRHESTIQELENYGGFKAKFDDVKAGSFERADPDTRKFIDRVYKSRGGDAAALYSVVSRTGTMPDSAVSTMNGDLASGDFARARRTVEQLVLLVKDHPNLLAADQRSADLQNAVTQFQYVKGRGSTSEEAIKQIIQTLSPEYQKALELKNKGVDAAKEIDHVTSLFDLDEAFAGDPASMAIMYMAYRNVAQERLRATGDPALAKAQALDHMKPIAGFGNSDADNVKRNDAPSVDGWVPTLAERAWYNALASFYLGTSLGAAQLNLVAKERQMVESDAEDDELLGEFYPALLENKPNKKGHREAALRSLRSAPQRHTDILADLPRYNAMKGYSPMAEAAVALIGQVGGSLPTPETLAGPLDKGVTWGARFLSGAWRQGAVNAVVNPAVQALSIAGGGQEKYDPWQHAMSVGVGSIVGGAGSALFGRRLVPAAFDGSTSAPHAPETLPSGVKGEEPVPPRAEARALVPQETPATPIVPGGKDPAHAPDGTSCQPGEVARFDTFDLGGADPSSARKIVQGESEVNILREGALQRKPILENDLQHIAAGIEGA